MNVTKIIKALENALSEKGSTHELQLLLDKPYNKALIENLLKQLKKYKENDKPFVLFFQPGACAPVDRIYGPMEG